MLFRSSQARAASTGPDAAAIRVVIPERLVLDDIARERLVRTLATAPASIVGVAGMVVDLEPGASYRTDAECPMARGRPGDSHRFAGWRCAKANRKWCWSAMMASLRRKG